MNPADYDAWYDSPRGAWIGDAEYRLLLDELPVQPGEHLAGEKTPFDDCMSLSVSKQAQP